MRRVTAHIAKRINTLALVFHTAGTIRRGQIMATVGADGTRWAAFSTYDSSRHLAAAITSGTGLMVEAVIDISVKWVTKTTSEACVQLRFVVVIQRTINSIVT